MKNYKITYSGNSTRFKNTNEIVSAKSQREAVENHYKRVLDDNYFPMGNGVILDCDGEIVAQKDYINFCYDGGYFNAQPVERKRVIDLTGFTREEVKELIDLEGYSLSTYYRAWKRKYLNVTVI